MNRRTSAGFALIGLLCATSLAAQNSRSKAVPAVAGTWQLVKGNVKGEGPKTVVIRPDSSASWGKETVRWRVVSEKIMIALGGEWEIYKLKLRGDRMSLSGGDLTEEITLRRVGPYTARPDSIAIPPDPDTVP